MLLYTSAKRHRMHAREKNLNESGGRDDPESEEGGVQRTDNPLQVKR